MLEKLDSYNTKESKQKTLSHYAQKKNSKWIKDLNIRLETTKLLEENVGSTLFHTSLNNIFFGCVSSSKGNNSKNKWDYIKLRSFGQ